MRRSSLAGPQASSLWGKSVLIVEDEPIIALQIHAALCATGASIIAATNSAEALSLIYSSDISVAVLDIRLHDRDCSAACRALFQRKIPFLFHTGYADAPVLREWPHVPVLTKPVSPEAIVAAVVAVVQ